MGPVIDWTLASTVAHAVASFAPEQDGTRFKDLSAAAQESERVVAEYTGLRVVRPIPPAEVVDRAAWIDANLQSLRSVLDPVADKLAGGLGPFGGALGSGLGMALAVETGALSGFLAQHVMGQYEFPVLDADVAPRLLFVSPNLARVAEALDADADDLLRWVALHETTHAVQFGAVPWLRPHLAGIVDELLGTIDVDPGALLRLPDLSDLRRLVDAVRDHGLTGLVANPQQRQGLERAQAFMAVIEGYAEHVMDAAGAGLIATLPELRTGLDRRRRERTGLLRVIERLLGFDLKMRQYEQGKAFCDAVVERAGIAGLNQVWSGPDALPTMRELDDPAGWLDRVLRSAA
jgi:coenzyme F420 biosynthesis associated uncharacterized protein